MKKEIVEILQNTDWSDEGIENMAVKIIALVENDHYWCRFCQENFK